MARGRSIVHDSAKGTDTVSSGLMLSYGSNFFHFLNCFVPHPASRLCVTLAELFPSARIKRCGGSAVFFYQVRRERESQPYHPLLRKPLLTLFNLPTRNSSPSMDFFATLYSIVSSHPEPEPAPATPIDAEGSNVQPGNQMCVIA
jgi:hypothetical protein